MTDRTYPLSPGDKGGTDTGKAAAEAMSPHMGPLHTAVMGYLAVPGPHTQDEVAKGLEASILAIRPRVSELRRLGMIQDTGDRRPNRSGHKAIVWQAKEQGS